MILKGNKENTLPTITYEEMEGTVHIKGRSISSEVDEYFNDFLPYLEDNLIKAPMDLSVVIELEYFNTKTAKLLLKFFDIIKKLVVEQRFYLDITWIVEEGDEDLMESAKDYEEITKLKFNYIEKPEE